MSRDKLRGILIIIAAVGLCLGLFALGFNTLRLHPVYRLGMDIVKNDPAVNELFGSPIRGGFFVPGTVKTTRYGSGTANLETAISGPEAHGTVFIYGTRSEGGAWQIMSMTIRIDGKTVLDYSGFEPEKGFQP